MRTISNLSTITIPSPIDVAQEAAAARRRALVVAPHETILGMRAASTQADRLAGGQSATSDHWLVVGLVAVVDAGVPRHASLPQRSLSDEPATQALNAERLAELIET